jgi:hypothetical protein
VAAEDEDPLIGVMDSVEGTVSSLSVATVCDLLKMGVVVGMWWKFLEMGMGVTTLCKLLEMGVVVTAD